MRDDEMSLTMMWKIVVSLVSLLYLHIILNQYTFEHTLCHRVLFVK